ncbi:MAG: serine/threonine protein kinase, partial [Nitrospirae bacterium]|nr:serine/threonine protein kinase [Nitrospirota bacterium]
MGVVYRGRDPVINRIVAIKTIKSPSAAPESASPKSDQKKLMENFYNEAKAVGMFSHPNIAQIYDVGMDGGVYYQIFEFVRGNTLKN